MNYRLVYIGLGLALVAVVALGIALSRSGEGSPLPEVVEAVRPVPGSQVPRQARLEVDMIGGYDVEIFVDDIRLPDNEVLVVAATGLYAWQPGPDRLFEAWNRGIHTVRIIWNTTTGIPDTGEYSWTFRSF